MTHWITLAPEIEEAAVRQAQHRGLSLDEYLPELLAQAVTQETVAGEPVPRTGADLLALWEREGAFLPHETAPDAPALARQLREKAQRRSA